MAPERKYYVKGRIDFETKIQLDKYRRVYNVTESQVIMLALDKFLNLEKKSE